MTPKTGFLAIRANYQIMNDLHPRFAQSTNQIKDKPTSEFFALYKAWLIRCRIMVSLSGAVGYLSVVISKIIP